MKYINNPFDILTQIIKENYPDTKCEIYIGEQMTDGIETFGCTLFPDDETDIPMIEIHYSLSLDNATEVLAHELAHVIAGKEAKHNQEWERVFEDIYKEFQRKLDEIFE